MGLIQEVSDLTHWRRILLRSQTMEAWARWMEDTTSRTIKIISTETMEMRMAFTKQEQWARRYNYCLKTKSLTTFYQRRSYYFYFMNQRKFFSSSFIFLAHLVGGEKWLMWKRLCIFNSMWILWRKIPVIWIETDKFTWKFSSWFDQTFSTSWIGQYEHSHPNESCTLNKKFKNWL